MPKVYKVWAFIEMQSDTTMEVSKFFLQTTISRISLQGFPYLALLHVFGHFSTFIYVFSVSFL